MDVNDFFSSVFIFNQNTFQIPQFFLWFYAEFFFFNFNKFFVEVGFILQSEQSWSVIQSTAESTSTS